MVRLPLALLTLLAVPLPAAAQGDAYSIPWFVQNPAARHRTIAACRDDWRYAAGRDTARICANAETAESRVYARRLRPPRALRQLDILPRLKAGNS